MTDPLKRSLPQGEAGGMASVLPRLQRMERALLSSACASIGPGQVLGPRFAAEDFDYRSELERTSIEDPCGASDLDHQVSRFFRGAIRPESDHALFNMVPQPDPDVTAAAALAIVHNSNCLMDAFGGEALLVEQQVARAIGRWVHWNQAMGISCTGGKLTLFYAIRNAIGRLWPDMRRTGVANDVQVLCSQGAHYCVEHVASLAGVGSDNCIRVAADGSGGMCPQALATALRNAHEAGKRVAAIICCGGTTIGFSCDDTRQVLDVVDVYMAECNPGQRPLLHLDSVIGWLYFTCLGKDPVLDAAVAGNAHDDARERVARVLGKLAGLHRFDSFGVDFHKNGLAPYASSFFIARDAGFMDALGQGDYQYSNGDFSFGQFRAYRYTVENSRPGNGILSAWVSLNKYGRSGLASYLWSLQQARDEVQQAMQLHGRFRPLNLSSCGWEIVFAVDFPEELVTAAGSLARLSMAFMQSCWKKTQAGEDLPLFSIVPAFRDPACSKVHDNAFLLYPMRPLGVHAWIRVLERISAQLDIFILESYAQDHSLKGACHVEQPIR